MKRKDTPNILRVSFIIAVLILSMGEVNNLSATSVRDSKHNLSVSGPGSLTAQEEREICIFCHTPHSATSEAPLWNRYDSGQTYIPYASSTASASIGQPTGNSKLCLSCHDGTVALGMVRSRPEGITMTRDVSVMPPGDSNLGTDLSNDHPISFTYDPFLVAQNPELNDPATLQNNVRLDQNRQVQCTSCHDPHNDQYGKFLNMDARYSRLCLQCHKPDGWIGSVHAVSSQRWNGVGVNPWPDTPWSTVNQNGCANCHRPHGAGGRERLLRYAQEEDNCLICHNGNVAAFNIGAELNKWSVHPVADTVGLHDPKEDAQMSSNRHVECADCHNPHARRLECSVCHNPHDMDAPRDRSIPPPLELVKGIDRNGMEVDPISYEYELCFRCHADSPNGVAYVNRQYAEMNTRLEFDSNNASYHPIENIGKNPDVPSLKAPYDTTSTIACSSCHNNDQSPENSGNGPRGPHGSAYRPLLERPLSWTDNQEENANSYALCYKCHDRNSILNNESFSEHQRHIRDERTPCSVCHDPHGVGSVNHLINFDLNVVTQDSGGSIYFEDLG
ncbi:MAG: hypothetical protein NUV91_04120, partial [Candidatus Omnitrophica bacterium]|nr:hypothetical protein [Candidatus Omnitrophota bacterium]